MSVSTANGPITFPGDSPGYPWVDASTISSTRVMDPSLVQTPLEAQNNPELVAWGFEDGQAALQITTSIPQLEAASPSERRAFSPFNDFGWHDWASYQLNFSQPIADPVLRVNSVPFSATTTDRRVASFASTFGVASAKTADGASVSVELKEPTGTLATAYVVDNNSVYPKDRENQLPYAGGMCDNSQTTYAPPVGSSSEQFLQDSRTYLNNPDLELITNPCGTIKIDTGGVPVSSLSMRHLFQSYRLGGAGLSTFMFDAFTTSTIQSFAVVVRNEVSGSPEVIPASYGSASHVVSSSKLGTKIVPAFDNEYLMEAKSGTAETHSDAGYDSVTTEQLDAAFEKVMPGEQVSVTIPLSGVDKDATVSAWIDFDGSGEFSSAEMATANVSAGARTVVLTWTAPEQFKSGQTYLRLRIGHTLEQVVVPTGMADSGEVEDHSLSLPSYGPTPTPTPNPEPTPDPHPPVPEGDVNASVVKSLAATGAETNWGIGAWIAIVSLVSGALLLRRVTRKTI
ncbi:hypothetical protein G7066_02845 [Leucobacter coleopterorum]|uniref:GEVED domain-containing protein n=1 Tax=Leucobacter coleopterorum TaxID=2714933 RepID=A0ABX6JUB2_9MICO|nr:GEVED domain-containing protein [Leucobacter coleopterorum]QIM17886.1 hypothetical protein G7066_02845 [Leucobacter coleopterorum]